MWETVSTLVKSIPAWYWMIVLPVAAVYILPRIRRDKNGKLYLYSSIYEAEKQRRKHSEVIELVNSKIDEHIKMDAERKDEVLQCVKQLADGIAALQRELDDRIEEINKQINVSIEDRKALHADVQRILNEIHGMTMELLKHTVFIDGIPIHEKIVAGLKYMSYGGNSEVKKRTLKNIEEYPEVYDAVIVIQPDLRVKVD